MGKQDQEHFGKVLWKARLKAGLSTRELARRAGLSHVAIVHFEKGSRSPTASTMMLLSALLPIAGPAIWGAYFVAPAINAANATVRRRLLVQNLISKSLKEQGAKVTNNPDGSMLVEIPRIGKARVEVSLLHS